MTILKTTCLREGFPGHHVRPSLLSFGLAATLRRTVSALALIAVLWTVLPATVLAQSSESDETSEAPTRTELLEDARRAKTDTVEAPTRSSVERGLRRFRDATDFVGNLRGGWGAFRPRTLRTSSWLVLGTGSATRPR